MRHSPSRPPGPDPRRHIADPTFVVPRSPPGGPPPRTAGLRTTTLRALGWTVLLGSVGCGGGGDAPTTPSAPAVERVVVTPPTATVTVGGTVTVSASARSSTGATLDESIAWSSSDAGVATVSGGVVTGVGEGTASIRATARGVTGTVAITVAPVPVASITLSLTVDTLFGGLTQQLTAAVKDAAGATLTGRTLAWSSSDPSVAQVSGDGLVTARAAGTASITATAGTVSASAEIEVLENPVRATSYENFKESGAEPVALPPEAGGPYDLLARGYGDFFGRGARSDLFTARTVYSTAEPQSEAQGAVYTFWRREGGGYVADNSILVPPASSCLHPRKAVVADFNMDGRPDVFVACHGYDAPPFPGERSQILLSQADGRYVVSDATDIGFWHGAAAADLNGDGYPDVVAVNNFDPDRAVVFLNDGDGTFTREATGRLPALAFGNYFSVELADVDEDGHPDLLLAGHEWEDAPTRVWINPGDGDFSGVSPVTIPAVANEGVVLDFVLTGTGPTRTLWLSRTSGGDGTFYQSAVLQRFDWSSRSASVAASTRPAGWVSWIRSYTRGAQRYVGSDDPRMSLEVAVP